MGRSYKLQCLCAESDSRTHNAHYALSSMVLSPSLARCFSFPYFWYFCLCPCSENSWRFFDRTTHRITISRDAIFCERFPLDNNGAPALPLSIEHPRPLISSISRPPIASDISNHLPPLPRQSLPCSSVVQLPGAIPSSLDDLSPFLVYKCHARPSFNSHFFLTR